MNIFKKSLIAAVATGLVLTGSNVAPMALAQQTVTPVNTVTIKEGATGSLIIHKHATPEGGATKVGNGLVDTSVTTKALQGAKFKVYKVNDIDLTTNEGWVKAAELAKKFQAAATEEAKRKVITDHGLGTATELVTDDKGEAKFEDKALGLYFVEETEAPAGHNIDTKPFLVTLPMTHPTELNSWLYEVHVYPKNKEVKDPTKPSKTVKDANTKAGEKITYQGTAPVATYDKLTQFRVEDFYPADRLEIDGTGVTKVTIKGTKAGQAATVDLVAADYKVNSTTAGQLLTTLTKSGINKLNEFEANDQRQVIVDMSFTVKELTGDPTGPVAAIENKLGVTQKNIGTPVEDPKDPPGDTPEWPRSYYGDVKIVKTGNEDKALAGVTFDVYRCDNATTLADQPLIQNAATTNDEGIAYIRGLQANNWQDNKAWSLTDKTADGDPREYLGYCLVETKTASGHELLTEPIFFQIEANAATKQVALVEKSIKNNPHNGGFELPLTGGQGVLFLLAGGVLLLVMAGGAMYVLRRREA